MRELFSRILDSRWIILLIILLSLIMHLGIFNKDLVGFHVWRQTQTQNTILSFAEEDLNILNPRRNERGNGEGVFRMEFPLSQWITALPVRAFGKDILWSRIINYFFGIISLFGIYYLGRRLFSSKHLALASLWILAFTPVFYYYSINPMPDNLALTFSIWGLFYFFRWYQTTRRKDLVLMTIMLSFSALCKLPFVLYFSIPALVIAGKIPTDKKGLQQAIKLGLILGAGMVPVAAWYLWVIPDWEGNGIVSGIFSMSEDQRNEFWYYMWFNLRTTMPELVIGIFTLPLFLIGVFSSRRLWRRSKRLLLAFAMPAILISGLLVFEMNMIETVHDYYFLPFLPLVVLLSVYGLKRAISLTKRKTWLIIPLIVLLLSMPVYSFFRIQERWDRVGFNEDLLTYKEQLREAVPDSALVCAGNDLSHNIFLYYIHKNGWVFEQDWMGKQKLEGLILQGCRYLYCDSRHVDQNPAIQSIFGTKVATFGEINVFKLKSPSEMGLSTNKENK